MNPHLQRAQLLIQQQRGAEAEQELRQALALEPQEPFAHGLLALALLQQNRLDEAGEASDASIHLAPDVAFFYRVRSLIFHHSKDYESAENTARRALELDPEDSAQYAALAAPLLATKQWQEALEISEKGLQIDARDVDLLNHRAMALTMLGRRAEAGRTLDVALHEQPENSDSHANMGWTLLHAGKHAEALEHFKEALRLDPSSDWARQGIIEALKARGLVYRSLLKFSLWMSRLSTRSQWILIIGLLVVVNAAGRIRSQEPWIQFGAAALVIGYTIFVFLVWMQGSLFNLLLRADRFGRLVLTDRQRADSNWIALAIAVSIGLIGGQYALLGITSPDYALPLLAAAVTLSLPADRRRIPLAITSVIYGLMFFHFARSLPAFYPQEVREAILAYGELAGGPDRKTSAADLSPAHRAALGEYFTLQSKLSNWFTWGSVGMTWLGSVFHSRR